MQITTCIQYINTPASAQMTESPNTVNGEMRVEGRVICPSKSTPTKGRMQQ